MRTVRLVKMNRLRFFLRFVVVPLFLSVLFCGRMSAQEEVEYRMEVGGALGMNSALSDVNSKLFGNIGVAGGGVLRFLLNPRMAVKTSLTYARLSGDATGVDEFYPAVPGQSGTERRVFKVKGGLYDLSALYEINFLPYGYVQGYQGYRRLVPYLQMGLGFTYSDAGSAFTVNVPMGLGIKYKVAERLNLGLEWRMHLTLSDKLEGLEAPLGLKSSGFKNKDHYSLTLLTLTYDISPRCPTCNKD